MPYDNDGFALSGKTWFEISKANYFKVLEAVKKEYGAEVEEILKPKVKVQIIDPLTRRDILGMISMFNLSNEFPNAQKAKMATLRTNFKNLVESGSNEELNNYLIKQSLQESALETKRKETKTEKIIHNKTKKLFNFIIEQYLGIELEKPEKK